MSRTVWITGAGSGIGAAMARAFAGAGYSVALTARGTSGLEAVAAEITAAGGVATIHEGDVTDRTGMAELAERIARENGGIHVLCNNAGLNIPNRRWAQLDWPSWDRGRRGQPHRRAQRDRRDPAGHARPERAA